MHPLHSPTYFFNLTENLAQAKQSERKSLQSYTFENQHFTVVVTYPNSVVIFGN